VEGVIANLRNTFQSNSAGILSASEMLRIILGKVDILEKTLVYEGKQQERFLEEIKAVVATKYFNKAIRNCRLALIAAPCVSSITTSITITNAITTSYCASVVTAATLQRIRCFIVVPTQNAPNAS
jgi:hypothetical protein